jgi:hypothetical protein
VTDPEAGNTSKLSLKEIATYSSTLVGLLCLIKVYSVAHYSTTTTATLITTAPENIVLGTLAVYVYPVLAALAYGIPWFSWAWRRHLHPGVWPLLLSAAVVAMAMTPPEYHLTGIALVAGSSLVEFVIRREIAARCCRRLRIPLAFLTGLRSRSLLYLGGVVVFFGFVDTLATPWMPAAVFILREPVVTSTQQDGGPQAASRHTRVTTSTDPVIGYVVEESLTGYTVLHATTRYVIYLEKSAVVNRYTCHQEGAQLRGKMPLLGRILGHAYRSPNSNCDEVAGQLAHLPQNQGAQTHAVAGAASAGSAATTPGAG